MSRYLFQHASQEYWIIADSPDRTGTEKLMSNWAYVESSASHPGEIPQDAPWYVWHNQTKSMKQWGVNLAEESKTCYKVVPEPVDEIKVGIVVGYEVTGLEAGAGVAGASFLLRHGSQFYGRPVYEADSVEQYLFWIEQAGSVDDGLVDPEMDEKTVNAAKEMLFSKPGYWVLASELPLEGSNLPKSWSTTGTFPHKDLSAIAWVEDTAVTPHAISDKSVWKVVNSSGAIVSNTEMRIRPEEWKSKVSRKPQATGEASAREDSAALALTQKKDMPSQLGYIPGLDDPIQSNARELQRFPAIENEQH